MKRESCECIRLDVGGPHTGHSFRSCYYSSSLELCAESINRVDVSSKQHSHSRSVGPSQQHHNVVQSYCGTPSMFDMRRYALYPNYYAIAAHRHVLLFPLHSFSFFNFPPHIHNERVCVCVARECINVIQPTSTRAHTSQHHMHVLNTMYLIYYCR